MMTKYPKPGTRLLESKYSVTQIRISIRISSYNQQSGYWNLRIIRALISIESGRNWNF